MRKLIAIAAAVIAITSPAIAANTYIQRPDGEITLHDNPCNAGGQQATFIETRQTGGGAYGCWEAKDGYVYVRWTQFIGPTGSILHTDRVERYKAPNDLAKQTQKPEALIKRVDQLDDQCRGGSGDDPRTMKACDQREAAMEDVRKAGWCWGPNDAYGYQKRWIRCR